MGKLVISMKVFKSLIMFFISILNHFLYCNANYLKDSEIDEAILMIFRCEMLANTVGPFVDKNKPFSTPLNGHFIMVLIAIIICIYDALN